MKASVINSPMSHPSPPSNSFPMQYRQSPMHARAQPDISPSQQRTTQVQQQQQQQSSQAPPPPSPKESPKPDPPKSDSKKPFDFEKLIQLQSWKSALDAQPENVRQKIWGIWENLTSKSASQYEMYSISKTVNTWAKDIATYSEAILNFHSAVECIKNAFSLDLDKQYSPVADNSPIQRSPQVQPSSPPRMQPQMNSPGHVNLAPVNSPRNGNINLVPNISLAQYQTAPFRLNFDNRGVQQYQTPPLGTISRTLRPLTRDVLPSIPQKRQMPSPSHDPKRTKTSH